MKRIGLPLSLALSLVLAAGCSSDIEQDDSASLRVLHLSPDTPPVEAFVDGANSGAGELSFGQSSDYLSLPAGEHTIDVGNTGSADSAQLKVGAVNLEARRYTAVAINRLDGIDAILFPDDDAGLADGSIRVRAIHAAPDVGQVDVLNIASDGTPSELVKNLDFGDFSGQLDVPAGAYTIGVDTDNDENAELYFQLPELPAGTLANVFVTQSPDGDVLAYAQLGGSTTAAVLPAVSELRVFHGSRNAPNVDIKANGQLAITDLPFASSSDTLEVQSGSYDLQVLVGGTDTVVIDAPGVTLLPGVAYTVVAYGDVDNLQAKVLIDDRTEITDGAVRLQVFHAAPEIENGDVYSLNAEGGAVDNLVPDLGFGGFGSTLDLPRAKYDIGFEADSTGLIIAEFEIPSLTVSAANVFIIQDHVGGVYLVAQLNGSSTALVCEASSEGPCALP